ncbi:MAG: FtsQ-type POTRA domain-containing protein [Holosporales bacterium]|jgi:cell division protein FtsQ|nr:FtsQ-type POTRA domain-containing protein [Holosporales bacterium]
MAKKKINRRTNKIKPKLFLIIFILCLILGGYYFYTNAIISIWNTIFTTSLKNLGLTLNTIKITGANSRTEKLIINNLNFKKGDNIFKFSTDEIYTKIKQIGWIKEAIVKKLLPNTLQIKIVQRTPIAVFQHDSILTLIDSEGTFIEDIKTMQQRLPIVVGEDANIYAGPVLSSIFKYENINKELCSMVFVRKRRWDLFICNGIQVKLPDNNIEKSLNILEDLLKQKKLNNKIVKSIDLRIPTQIIIKGLKPKNNHNVV